MKPLLALLVLIALLPQTLFAANLFSTDLERSSSQYWSITDGSQSGLQLTNAFTLSMWVKLESFPDGAVFRLINKFHTDTSNRSYSFLLVNVGGNPDIRVALSSTGSNVEDDFVSWSPSTGTWYHIAVSYNGTAGEVKFYVDGVQQGTTQTTGISSLFNNSVPFLIGTGQGGGGGTPENFFDGLMNNVLVYNAVLDDAAIAALYSNGCSPSTTNLVSWWFADNNNGNDLNGSNNLTNNNSATFSADVPFSVCAAAAAPSVGTFYWGDS